MPLTMISSSSSSRPPLPPRRRGRQEWERQRCPTADFLRNRQRPHLV